MLFLWLCFLTVLCISEQFELSSPTRLSVSVLNVSVVCPEIKVDLVSKCSMPSPILLSAERLNNLVKLHIAFNLLLCLLYHF